MQPLLTHVHRGDQPLGVCPRCRELAATLITSLDAPPTHKMVTRPAHKKGEQWVTRPASQVFTP
jgi:hypothetical protein